MNSKSPILFVGDPHMNFDSIKEAAASHAVPGMVVCVGDFQLPYPARSPEIFGGLFKAGWDIRFVLGNHDSDTCQQLDYLLGEQGGYPVGNLHCRVVDIGGLRVAGLGGVFKGRIWLPDKDVRYASREDWMKRNRERWRGGLPIHLRDAIFPEDFEQLGGMRADVLICHEGPSSVCRDQGWSAIDDLAKRMGARLIVYGHHHHSGSALLPNGLSVRSLGIAETWELPR